MEYARLISPRWLIIMPVLLVMVLAVACGTDATPTPVVIEVIKEVQVTVEVPKEVIKEVEVTKEVIKEVIKEVEVTPTPTATPEPIVPPAVVAEAGAKSGGTFTYVWTAKPGQFDLQQSSTIANLGPQGPQFNGLIRPNPLDGARSIGPDLAHSWKISEDGTTYTFFLREGVKFHDGGDFTSEDAVATWSRILDPPAGILSVRKAFFNAVSGIEALDPLTVRFNLNFPAPVTLEGIAMEWNIILRKKTLEDNNFDLKTVQDPPGTGAFKFKSHTVAEKWVSEKFPDYWNEGLPYVDEFVMLHSSSTARAGIVLSGRADAGSSSPEGRDLAKERGFQWGEYAGMLPWVLIFNHTRSPWDNVNVRKAIDLVLPRQVMQESKSKRSRTFIGRWFPPVSVYAQPEEEILKILAMKEDKTEAILEAKKLLADAGYADGIKGVLNVRDSNLFVTDAEIIQAQLLKHLNIDLKIEVINDAIMNEVIRKRTFEIAQTAYQGATFDPSESLNSFYGCAGGQNYGHWCNREFDAIMSKVDREVDQATRIQLVHQAFDVLEREVPSSVFAYSGLIWIAWPHAKNMPDKSNAGPYALLRWDNVWIDK